LAARSGPRSGLGVAVPKRVLYSSKMTGNRARSETLAWNCDVSVCNVPWLVDAIIYG